MDKYMAYVGSYSYTGEAKGITCYDVDVENGRLKYRCEVEVDNSSYLICSHTKPVLYSIADEGVVAFRILPNGTLTRLNSQKINGMRGCHLSISPSDKYICVSGYHDGKATVLSVKPDGSVGSIKYQFYNKGYGSVADRTFRPHITCTRLTKGCEFIFSADSGIDQVKIFKFDPAHDEELRQVDALRCERGSSPRFFRFSPDGRFMYLIYEVKNVIEVYSYQPGVNAPIMEKIQTISTTLNKDDSLLTAACAIRLTSDGKHVLVSNAGENTVTIFDRDEDTGLLTFMNSLPISGDYPKDISLFPDGKHLAVANHQSNELSFFKIDYEKGLLIMNGRNIPVNQPNSVRFVKL